ncbi:hypothetical protein ACFYY8_16170 [Streptosporangium sp. NPDC001559]|uniref:hypothetical protein n=1 Tax=Streptosporangium sp. NPDC001559 TaxID=3366187 RepID=UPI0036EFF133
MASTGEFCGIDPDEMGRLAVSLDGAAARLTRFCHELGVRLQQEKADVPALREIATIAEWGKSQCSMLLGRADLIRNLSTGAPELGSAVAVTGGQGLVHLPDDLESMELAQELARMYENDILTRSDGDALAGLIHEHADEVTALADHPQAAAAFFAMLPAKSRDKLPSLLTITGSETAKQDLAAFSKALGAALNAPPLVPAFAKVREDLTKPAGSKIVAWNRLTLLKGTNAPARVRSAVARALVLDDFMKNPKQDWRANFDEAKKYDLPPDLVAMALEVLAGDGAAVREAFAGMGGPDVKLSRVEKMKLFLDYADQVGAGDEVADAFGRVLESGAEATTEKPGQHSQAAAAFALDAMLVTGPFGVALPATAKDSMGVIGRSYVHELASGARFDKAANRASGMHIPEHWVSLPGVTPAFYLSPGDAYRFMKTFVEEENSVADFNSAMARFRHDTLLAAARLDAQSDNNYFRDVSMMFGDFSSVMFKATKDALGEEDAAGEHARNFIKNTSGFLMGGFSFTNEFIDLGWEVFQAYGFSDLGDRWDDSFEKQVEKATGQRADLARRMKFDMAYLLYSGGYPTSRPPQELVNTATGTLKTYEELVIDAKREAAGEGKWEEVLRVKLSAYENWMDENGKLDGKVEDAARFQTSDLAENSLRD